MQNSSDYQPSSLLLIKSHPLLVSLLPWFIGVCGFTGMVVVGAVFRVMSLFTVVPVSLRPTAPLAATILGLGVGVVLVVLLKKSWLRDPDAGARRLLRIPSPESPSFRTATPHPGVPRIVLVVMVTCFAVVLLYARSMLHHFVRQFTADGLLGVMSFFCAFLFLYPDRSLIQQRARQLMSVPASPATDSQILSRPRWPLILGGLTVVGCFVGAGILQFLTTIFGLSATPQPDPLQKTSITEPGGRAVRLSYNGDACMPALSADGKQVACLRLEGLMPRLQIMHADGSDKRWVDDRVWLPAGLTQISWQSDNRFLFCGAQMGKMEKSGISMSVGVWAIDTHGQHPKLVLKGENIVDARYSSSGTSLVFIKQRIHSRENHLTAELWRSDPAGSTPVLIMPITEYSPPLTHTAWRDGSEVVFAGDGNDRGIWTVALDSGTKRRVSNLPVDWVLPLDDTRIVFQMSDRTHPEHSSLGLLDTATEKIQWFSQNVEWHATSPRLLGHKELIFIRQIPYRKGKREFLDLWQMRVSDGRLKQLTQGKPVFSVEPSPVGRFILYVTAGKKPVVTKFPPSVSLGLMIWRMDMKEG